MRRAMLAIGIAAGLLVLGSLVLDEGEVVTLLTEKGGRQYSTQLWVVEVDGRQYVRANRPNALWLARLATNPAVELRRDSAPHPEAVEIYWASLVDDPAVKARVDAEIARKYHFADRTWGRFAKRSDSLVIELLPRSPDRSARPELGAGS